MGVKGLKRKMLFSNYKLKEKKSLTSMLRALQKPPLHEEINGFKVANDYENDSRTAIMSAAIIV